MNGAIQFLPIQGLGSIQPGNDLASMILERLVADDVRPVAGDVLVVAQKIVSKSEGRLVRLDDVTPSPGARDLAEIVNKDPRLVELILSESIGVVRACPNVLIVRHRRGWVMANAGIDRSNLDPTAGETVLLLPLDPDGSAMSIRDRLFKLCGCRPAVIVSDSFGRPWRRGVVNIALGSAGLASLVDLRGRMDRSGRPLQVTEVAVADAITAGAGLVMGEADENVPAALVRGFTRDHPANPAADLIRPLDEDLFP